MFCKRCGVELENEMTICPLCGTSVNGEKSTTQPATNVTSTAFAIRGEEKHLLQRILWQITSILLFSGITATLIIDITIHKTVTWAIYPVTICTIVFLYASFFALWHRRLLFKILGGWIVSSIFLLVLQYFIKEVSWIRNVALPMLCAVNVVSIGVTAAVLYTRKKGLNVLAYIFVGVAILCLSIEGILSYHAAKKVYLQWSIIVAACLLPVTAALFFMYLRTRKNPDLQKIFHT
ncbi:MAG: hypothetical protein C0490_08600 [Marivirga sp.]|nr:hypothetical protein [Marivirga sp.]